MRGSSLVFIFLFVFISCKRTHEFKEASFYYWKTTYAVSEYEQEYLQDLNANKIYYKAFDVVDQDPVGVLKWQDDIMPGYNYVPVVFIDHEVFREIDSASNKRLAKNIFNLLNGVCMDRHFKPQEVQIDCDWTKGTKDNYFFFLKQLKIQTKCTVSSTIRLHQIKFKKSTGVPPCDYGVLMCYNMGNMKSSLAKNSIYDAGILDDYLKNASYDLPLKAALPIFDWMLWYRGERFLGILNRADNFDNIHSIAKKQSNGFNIEKDSVVNGHAFQSGDYVRDETISSSNLIYLKQYLSESNLNLSPEIIYFSLDSLNLSHYEKSSFTP